MQEAKIYIDGQYVGKLVSIKPVPPKDFTEDIDRLLNRIPFSKQVWIEEQVAYAKKVTQRGF